MLILWIVLALIGIGFLIAAKKHLGKVTIILLLLLLLLGITFSTYEYCPDCIPVLKRVNEYYDTGIDVIEAGKTVTGRVIQDIKDTRSIYKEISDKQPGTLIIEQPTQQNPAQTIPSQPDIRSPYRADPNQRPRQNPDSRQNEPFTIEPIQTQPINTCPPCSCA
ncbi:hypothetical protein HY486_03030 [Candidatus Woesearchaeota archaeon]|nr:hypothetical protein [Candidatus Woesearchaeota archaeon]